MKKILIVLAILMTVPLVAADPWSFSLTTWGTDSNPFSAGYYTSSFYDGANSVRVQRDFSQFMGHVKTDSYSAGVTFNTPPTYIQKKTDAGGYNTQINRGTNWQLERGFVGSGNSGFSIARTPNGGYGGTGYVNGFVRPRSFGYSPYYGYPSGQYISTAGWPGYGYNVPRGYSPSRVVVYT